ncbi:MAG TPA: nucleoside transporter C-terminal domain-containing protein [Alphaproteobacteria bacterium]|nr:nucleoside transporter C-terminal domain-containing protein [Alphaproteobacteria bacterium]
MVQFQSALGVVALLAIAWGFSESRATVRWRDAAAGLALTVVLAVALLNVPALRALFAILNRGVEAIAAATRAGTAFAFGYVGGGPTPFAANTPEHGFILAFQALPIVLIMSVLTTLLFYWGILPRVVRALAWALQRTMGVGGAVSLATAANIFVGMVEAPLFIRPYLARLSRSELFVVMTGGMAGIAGTVMALYATLLAPTIQDAFGHILVASVLGAPAAIVVARIMVPERGEAANLGQLGPLEPVAANTMDAVVRGTIAGVELLINIVAMLIVLVALVYLANAALGSLPDVAGAPLTLQRLLGYAFAPICWLMGVPWQEAVTAGALMGLKTILNELIAYAELAATPAEALSARSRLIMLYALCGFANFGSLGIMIGGLGTMVPERRAEIVGLGFKSIVSGTLVTCLLGAIVGLLA